MNMINLIDPNDWDCPCEFCTESDYCDEVEGCGCSVCRPDLEELEDEE